MATSFEVATETYWSFRDALAGALKPAGFELMRDDVLRPSGKVTFSCSIIIVRAPRSFPPQTLTVDLNGVPSVRFMGHTWYTFQGIDGVQPIVETILDLFD